MCVCVCVCVCTDTGSYLGCFLGKGMELRLKGQMREVAKQLENILSWRLEEPERRPGHLDEQEATRHQEGREQLWAEASSPPGLPGSRRHQQSWVEPSYLGTPTMLMQDSPWLPLPPSRNPGFSEGRSHPPWSGPCPALPTFQPGQFTFPVPPATLLPHSELCPPLAI